MNVGVWVHFLQEGLLKALARSSLLRMRELVFNDVVKIDLFPNEESNQKLEKLGPPLDPILRLPLSLLPLYLLLRFFYYVLVGICFESLVTENPYQVLFHILEFRMLPVVRRALLYHLGYHLINHQLQLLLFDVQWAAFDPMVQKHFLAVLFTPKPLIILIQNKRVVFFLALKILMNASIVD